MRTTTVLCALVALPLAAACTDSSSGSESEVHAAEMKQKAGETLQAAKAYGYAKRDELATELEQRIADLDGKIDELAAEADTMAAEGKAQLEDAVAKLRDVRDQAETKAAALRDAGADAWSQLRDGALASFETLEKAVDDTAKKEER
jgi:TolA-binding protein